jgi:hypothetical protein
MNALFTRWLLVTILLAGFYTTAAPLAHAHTSADVTIYADALASGWEDWGRFGDVRIAAASSDQERVSVYASQRSSDGAVTIVAINKSGGVQRTQIRIDNFNGAASAQVYQYSPSNLNAIVRAADQTLTGAAFIATLPADSMTLFVIPADNSTPGDEMTNHLFLPAISR